MEVLVERHMQPLVCYLHLLAPWPFNKIGIENLLPAMQTLNISSISNTFSCKRYILNQHFCFLISSIKEEEKKNMDLSFFLWFHMSLIQLKPKLLTRKLLSGRDDTHQSFSSFYHGTFGQQRLIFYPVNKKTGDTKQIRCLMMNI